MATLEIQKLDVRLTSHENVCEERYANILDKVSDAKVSVDRIYKLLWAAMSSLVVLLLGGSITLISQISSLRVK